MRVTPLGLLFAGQAGYVGIEFICIFALTLIAICISGASYLLGTNDRAGAIIFSSLGVCLSSIGLWILLVTFAEVQHNVLLIIVSTALAICVGLIGWALI